MKTIPSATKILTDQECYDFLGVDDNDSDHPIIAPLRTSVEAWVQNVYCKRNFISTEYRKDRYNGNNSRLLQLRNYPISNVARVAINTENVISIRNTRTGTICSVSANDLGVKLNVDWTVTTLLFADYATLSLMVDAINARSADGWVASLMASNRSSLRSDEIIETFGQNARENVMIYLDVPYQPEYGFDVLPDSGQIDFYAGFPGGVRNIFVDYTAGYATTTIAGILDMPEDLKLGIKILLKHAYQRRDEESFSVDSYSVSGVSMSFSKDGVPTEAKKLLSKYRRNILGGL
jgi:hypothetical protein